MNIPNFVTWKKKREKRGGHMIKCLLTELGLPDGKIFGPRSWRTDLAVLGPYAMTSGQIFSHPATQSIST